MTVHVPKNATIVQADSSRKNGTEKVEVTHMGMGTHTILSMKKSNMKYVLYIVTEKLTVTTMARINTFVLV